MQKNKQLCTAMMTVGMLIMAACGNTSDGSDAIQNTNGNSSLGVTTEEDHKNGSAGTEIIDNNEPNEIEETSTTEPAEGKEEASSTSLKEKYLQQLNDINKEVEELEAIDSSTYALKKVENDRWELWDELLNEVYGVLEEQLPAKEMEKLREEQRNWIKNRDDSALEASHKYKGGTQEHLEYVAVLANLTEERCYELVENYMN